MLTATGRHQDSLEKEKEATALGSHQDSLEKEKEATALGSHCLNFKAQHYYDFCFL